MEEPTRQLKVTEFLLESRLKPVVSETFLPNEKCYRSVALLLFCFLVIIIVIIMVLIVVICGNKSRFVNSKAFSLVRLRRNVVIIYYYY